MKVCCIAGRGSLLDGLSAGACTCQQVAAAWQPGPPLVALLAWLLSNAEVLCQCAIFFFLISNGAATHLFWGIVVAHGWVGGSGANCLVLSSLAGLDAFTTW